MTKSFTAAMTLLLRDEGVLGLDDPVGIHVPELAGFKGPTADSPLITLRHLLTMDGGLSIDDPWGDRLQGLPLDRFSELLAEGFEFAWTPGTAFEYSNLGYGILGRVLSSASGIEYRDLVWRRILEPLGLSATCYDADDVPSGRLVQGHTHRDDAFVDEPFDGYGALASMGGIFSSVRDLATWVAGFADAFPARDDPDTGHPLGRASRREMQQVHRSLPSELEPYDPALAPPMDTTGYGFGLFVQSNLAMGHVVAHSGGYPGFGSHMRWHVASGMGVIALGNRTYAPMYKPCTEALATLVNADVSPVRTVVSVERDARRSRRRRTPARRLGRRAGGTAVRGERGPGRPARTPTVCVRPRTRTVRRPDAGRSRAGRVQLARAPRLVDEEERSGGACVRRSCSPPNALPACRRWSSARWASLHPRSGRSPIVSASSSESHPRPGLRNWCRQGPRRPIARPPTAR